MVDALNHYGGWYCGIDVKYQTRAYLFCEKNLPLVLTGWQHTVRHCRLSNGGIQSTEGNGLGTVFGFRSKDGTTITYALRASGTIDLILTGDMIFRFSQDREWLRQNISYMRDAARWLESWIDDEGMLDSQDYDHDSLMRRGTDGTAQASAYLAMRKLAALEDVLGHAANRSHYDAVADRMAAGAKRHLWDAKLGYFYEYAETNDIARSDRLGAVGGVSSEYSADYAASKAIDGVLGYGSIDPVGIGAAAGQREWAAKGETVGAWIQVNLKAATAINRVILYNRQAFGVPPCETFAAGHLDFSDGSSVPVHFGPGHGSRAVVPFASRTVTWVKFTGDKMQADGTGNAGLAEFEIHPTDAPYRKHTHGMSDVNFAMIGYGLAGDEQAARIWRYFRAHEDSFYRFRDAYCPTWTTELPETYTDDELNSINPDKDRTALARVWRHDVWMRRRMGDAEGIYKTIRYANDLYRRPSGGGRGFFGERYDLGRFTPGDDGQDSTPKYAEYPAEYNATVVGEILLGVSADVRGTIHIDPCVPAAWYTAGFGIENPGVLKDRDFGYACDARQVRGWVKGKAGSQSFRVLLPPGVKTARVLHDGNEVPHTESGRYTNFVLKLAHEKTHTFSVQDGVPR